MTRVLRWLLPLLFTSLLATGCSLAKFGYDAFPYWAMWQLDGYVDLDDGQRVLARNAIDDLRAWHEQAELPRYARFLKQVDARVQGVGQAAHGAVQGAMEGAGAGTDAAEPGGRDAIRPAEFGEWRQAVIAYWAPLADRVAAPAAVLLTSLTPAQIERLKGRMADDNRDMARKYRIDSPQGIAQARADRFIERSEYFLGRLSGDQKRELRESAARLPAEETLRLAEREERQRALLALIARLQAERPPAAVGQAWTRDYLMSMVRYADPQRREQLERAQRAADEVTARTVNEASDAQRRHLSKRLRDFAADFERRAGRG